MQGHKTGKRRSRRRRTREPLEESLPAVEEAEQLTAATAPREAHASPRSTIRVWWCTVALAFAGACTYINTLSNPFVFDDHATVVENEQIRDLSSPQVLLPERELPVAGRPVTNLSFALNYALGRFDVRGYRVVNIAVHILCGLLLFGIVRRTLLLPFASRLSSRATGIAFAAALLWLLHPLNSEAVDYLTQRTESMMGLFYLLTLYASLRAAGV
jgi:hypothetical protein